MAEQARLQLQLEQRISQNDARMGQLLTALTARAARGPARHRAAAAAAPAAPASGRRLPAVAAPTPEPVELRPSTAPPPRLRTVPPPAPADGAAALAAGLRLAPAAR